MLEKYSGIRQVVICAAAVVGEQQVPSPATHNIDSSVLTVEGSA
jgi:hypothetical protein